MGVTGSTVGGCTTVGETSSQADRVHDGHGRRADGNRNPTTDAVPSMICNEIVVAVRPTPADETEAREVSESLTMHAREIERQLRSRRDEYLSTTECGTLNTVSAR